MSKPYPLKRRALLRGALGTVIALPLFESLAPREVGAQTGASTPRFVLVMQPLGVFPEQFWPRAPGQPAYSPRTAPVPVYRSGTTALDATDFVLSESHLPLEPHRNELLVVEGLDAPHAEHEGFTTATTGFHTNKVGGDLVSATSAGPSIDQQIARLIGQGTRFPSLQFGVRSGDSVPAFNTASWYGAAQPAACQNSSVVLFERLFGDGQVDTAAFERLRAERRSVLDTALEQAQTLRQKLSAADQRKADLYLEAFRSVEQRLDVARPSCAPPTKPADRDWDSFDAIEHVPEIARTQTELLTLALACDQTRVGYLQIASEGSCCQTFPWLDVAAPGWHDLSHTGPGTENMAEKLAGMMRIARWHMQLVADLVQRLKELDAFANTTVLYLNSMSNPAMHNNENLPAVLVSGPQTKLRTGRHLRLAETQARFVNDLHSALLTSFGAPEEPFGDPELGRGVLPGVLA